MSVVFLSAFAMRTNLDGDCNARLHITAMRLIFDKFIVEKLPFPLRIAGDEALHTAATQLFFVSILFSTDVSPLCDWCVFVLVRVRNNGPLEPLSEFTKIIVDIAPFSFGEWQGMRTESLFVLQAFLVLKTVFNPSISPFHRSV